ncbi:PHP domain-containing protein [Candidatus Thorarchaeota archaeon]|nr:MAG: PHP domain-containing protein [Candidatus Thorarchaeota archaeon]
MKQYSFDVHMHTHYSYDSLLTPRHLVRTSDKKGHSAIIVTDHNTTKGGFASIKAAKNSNLELSVFVGAEIKTEHGDVIGLFLNDEIKSRCYHDVIDEIHAQDGIIYLPHPFARHTRVKDMDLSRIQVVEAYNSRSNIRQNRRALSLGIKLGLPVLGGSDAHIRYEIGCVRNLTDVDISQEETFRKVVLHNMSSIRVHHNIQPLIPQLKINEFMSWIRSGQSERAINRILLFMLRQTRNVTRVST